MTLLNVKRSPSLRQVSLFNLQPFSSQHKIFNLKPESSRLKPEPSHLKPKRSHLQQQKFSFELEVFHLKLKHPTPELNLLSFHLKTSS